MLIAQHASGQILNVSFAAREYRRRRPKPLAGLKCFHPVPRFAVGQSAAKIQHIGLAEYFKLPRARLGNLSTPQHLVLAVFQCHKRKKTFNRLGPGLPEAQTAHTVPTPRFLKIKFFGPPCFVSPLSAPVAEKTMHLVLLRTVIALKRRQSAQTETGQHFERQRLHRPVLDFSKHFEKRLIIPADHGVNRPQAACIGQFGDNGKAVVTVFFALLYEPQIFSRRAIGHSRSAGKVAGMRVADHLQLHQIALRTGRKIHLEHFMQRSDSLL